MTEPSYEPPPGLPPDHVEDAIDLDRLALDERQDSRLAQLVSDIKDYQLTHGNLLKLVRFEEPTRVPTVGVNISCTSTPFPRQYYDEAVALQQCMNELYVRCASDPDWLYSVIKPQIESEPAGLEARLWDVHVKCREAGSVQDVSCGIFRSDYMLHEVEGTLGLKQVEMNTLSVAGACHSEIVAGMHRYLYRRELAEMGESDTQSRRLPPCTNIASLVSGLASAHQMYQRNDPSALNRPKCVLMVVQPFNFNVADERPIEYGLWDQSIACYRCEWQAVLDHTKLGSERELLYTPVGSVVEHEVTVVYYRAGYDAAEYADEDGRGTRLTLERSRAIKCPDVLMHMAGFKSVQQALAEDDMMGKFLTSDQSKQQLAAVRETFMPMHVLDESKKGLEARKLATDPAQAINYVLKPNLEGGGNNIFHSDIPEFLARVPQSEWHRYILMRIITPPSQTTGILLTAEDIYDGPVVSELGILGFAMWRRKQADVGGKGKGKGRADTDAEVDILRNETVGWTFKTKPRDVDEMSVVKGYGCFDCPLLT